MEMPRKAAWGKMKRILLSEYARSEPVELARDELAGLQGVAPAIRVEPSPESEDLYVLTPDSHVGVIRLGRLTLEIRPKLPIDRFFFILSYAVDPSLWRDELVEFSPEDTVLEAVAPAFCRLVARATYRGLLHGYRTEEDALPLVRGRIRFNDQIRQRHGRLLPVEIRFDEFTEDINENRILLAALHCLGRLPLRSAAVRRGLHEIAAAFHAVTPIKYGQQHIPSVSISRLNRHYEPAINLARLIIQCGSPELGGAGVAGTCFLVDMNEVFEMFVHRALKEALHLTDAEFPRGASGLRLDEAGAVRLEPDLSWWREGRCRFVGDAKYKKVNVQGVKHPDLYQLLAYLTGADLPAGVLVYAAGEGEPAQHVVRHSDKMLIVESLDLAGAPDSILQQISQLAGRIRELSLTA